MSATFNALATIEKMATDEINQPGTIEDRFRALRAIRTKALAGMSECDEADVVVLKADRENLHQRVRELVLGYHELMSKLADLLDEDHFAACEDIVRRLNIQPPSA